MPAPAPSAEDTARGLFAMQYVARHMSYLHDTPESERPPLRAEMLGRALDAWDAGALPEWCTTQYREHANRTPKAVARRLAHQVQEARP